MTLQEFQSLITSFALIGAGIWSLYVFNALDQLSRSKIELQNLQLESEKAALDIRKAQAELQKLQLEIKKQAILEVTISSSQQTLPGDSSRYVSAVVEIENKGTRNERLSYEGGKPFLVTPITFGDNGEVIYENAKSYAVRRSSDPTRTSPGTTVRAGGKERHVFFFRVESSGVYLLTFVARLSPEEQRISEEIGTPTGRPTSWTGKQILIVT